MRAGIQCDDRRLVEHDAFALGKDEGVGRPKVDGEVSSHRAIVGAASARPGGGRTEHLSEPRDPPDAAAVGTLVSVSGDPPNLGGFDADAEDADESTGELGWVSPDDRLWRHPSEVGRLRSLEGAPNPSLALNAPNRPNGRLLGGAALLVFSALLVSGVVLATSGATPSGGNGAAATTAVMAKLSPPTTEAGIVHLLDSTGRARALTSVRPSLVALTVVSPAGTRGATGVIAEAGGIIVTSTAAVAGASSISTQEADGTREPVEIVGKDIASGIAVMRVTNDLPVATFDLSDPAPGSTAMAVAMTMKSRRAASPVTVYAGAVVSSGTLVSIGAPASGMASTVVDAPVGGHAGCVLLNNQGQVTGILGATRVHGRMTTAAFVPSALVLGVAQQLISEGSVDRGWLGVEASTATGGGATVDAINPAGSAAQVGMKVGDTIVAINGEAVHSEAELRTRLYADQPGTWVSVTFARGGTYQSVGVVLAAGGMHGSQLASSS